MKLLWIGAFVLLVASLASLVSGGHGDSLVQQGWFEASSIVPETTLAEIQHATRLYTAQLLDSLPEPVREKLAPRMRSTVELTTFRFFMLVYVTPAFLLPLLIGLLEGSWARANQTSLIKIHSPMRFSLALTGLCLIPVVTLLWLAAPIAISGTMLVVVVNILAIFNTRNIIVHAPTQF